MGHECHATGCSTQVPPRMLMCLRHWYMVPKSLQAEVWRTYREGQEITKDPSDDYMVAQRAAVEAVEKREAEIALLPKCEACKAPLRAGTSGVTVGRKLYHKSHRPMLPQRSGPGDP